jgi:hypothetical protein
MNGIYTATSSNCLVTQNGLKLAYINSNLYDYTVTFSNTIQSANYNASNVLTTFTITLNNAAVNGDIIDITVWPSIFSNQAIIQPGYVYQTFSNLVWGLCNNNAIPAPNVANIGIGTTNPQANLHVVGSAIISNTLTTSNINFTGTLLQNGSPYIGSQWTTASNVFGYNIYVNSNVGIGTTYTRCNLDVWGNGQQLFGVTPTQTLFNFTTMQIPNIITSNAIVYSGITAQNIATQNGNINIGSGALSTTNSLMYRNRIINGDMRIIQRIQTSNATMPSIYSTSNSIYTVDRWAGIYSNMTAGIIGASQVILQTTDTPYQYGFSNSLRWYTSNAVSIPGGGYFAPTQSIEGYNIADCTWGSSNATSNALSFWLRTNMTPGNVISVVLRNVPTTYSYITNIVTSNVLTWGYYTFTIPPPPIGSTWNTSNYTGVQIMIGGSNSGTQTTLTGWQSGAYYNGAYTTSWFSTVGNFIEFTGVQFEKGPTATPFEFRPYPIELQLCQRYYYQMTSTPSTIIGAASYSVFGIGSFQTTSSCWVPLVLPVPMRFPYYVVTTSATSSLQIIIANTGTSISSITIQGDSYLPNGITLNVNISTTTTAGYSGLLRASGLNSPAYAFIGIGCEL